MRRPRRESLHRPTPSLAAFILVMQLLLANCAAERATTQKGDSAPSPGKSPTSGRAWRSAGTE